MAYTFCLSTDNDDLFALTTKDDFSNHVRLGVLKDVSELTDTLEKAVSDHIKELSYEKCEKLLLNPCEKCDGAGDCGDCTNNEDDWEIEDVDPEDFLSDDDDDDDGYEVGEIIIPIEIPVPSPFDLFLVGAGLLLGFLIFRRK